MHGDARLRCHDDGQRPEAEEPGGDPHGARQGVGCLDQALDAADHLVALACGGPRLRREGEDRAPQEVEEEHEHHRDDRRRKDPLHDRRGPARLTHSTTSVLIHDCSRSASALS